MIYTSLPSAIDVEASWRADLVGIDFPETVAVWFLTVAAETLKEDEEEVDWGNGAVGRGCAWLFDAKVDDLDAAEDDENVDGEWLFVNCRLLLEPADPGQKNCKHLLV